MKKVLFVVLSLFIVSLTVSAQQGNRQRFTPEESAKRQTEQMTTELKLTADQVKKVDPINLEFAKKQQQLMQNSSGGDRAAMRESFQKLQNERIAALEKVLTKEQAETYKKAQAERRGRMGGGGGPRNN